MQTDDQDRPRVLIAVPFYKNEHLVVECLGGLLECAADLRRIGAEVVCYNDSPGYAPLAEALAAFAGQASGAFALRIETNAQNLGFVKTMNQGVAEAVARRLDLVMLNSDAKVTPGALPEMLAVADLDYMTGFVTPRSNNATLATLPFTRGQVGADGAGYPAAHRAHCERLPRVAIVPTGVGFCLLVRWRIIAEFGGFDEIYGHGYNEENDLIMRAARCGYRAVMANRAFVWHEGEASIGSTQTDRSSWERTNRAILDSRYPEYGPYTWAYFESPEVLGEQILGALIPDADGKLELAFDFSSFRAAHNGTFQAGYQILQHAKTVWGARFNIQVLCAPDVYAFHGYGALEIPRADPHERRRYAVIFRVGQPYDWNVIERLSVMGAVIGVYMLDTISIDCPQLTSSRLYNIWQFGLDHFDFVVAQSRHTRTQFLQRFRFGARRAPSVALHSVDPADYTLPAPAAAAGAVPARRRFLIVGNHYHHKYLAPTANALAAALPDADFTALGLSVPKTRAPAPADGRPTLAMLDNLQGLAVGELSDEALGAAYAEAEAVIFPSHAEGFGFPALNALAAKKPVFLRRLPVFEELFEQLGHTPNMRFYDSTAELAGLLAAPVAWIETGADAPVYDALASARQIAVAIDQALADVSYDRIVARIRGVQFIGDMAHGAAAPQPEADRIAQLSREVGRRVERYARRVLRNRAAFLVSRAVFRAVRRVVRLGRR